MFNNKKKQAAAEAQQAEAAELRARIEAFEADKAELERRIATLDKANARLDSRLALLDHGVVALGNQVNDLASANHATSAQLRTLDERIPELDLSVPELDERIPELDDRISTLREQLTALSEQTSAIDTRVTSVSMELTNQLTELGHDIEELNRRSAGDTDQASHTDASSPVDTTALEARIAERLDTAIDDVLDTTERLAAEQARYEIKFRADLAELADRLRRPGTH